MRPMEHREALNETPAGWDMTPGESEVDLVELFYLLWGRIWVILGCLAAGAAAALVITRFCITPLYEATSSLYIVSASNNSVVNLTDLQIGSQLTADYQELMRSRPLLEDVISRLALEGMTTQDLECPWPGSTCPRSWRPRSPTWWRKPLSRSRRPAPAICTI